MINHKNELLRISPNNSAVIEYSNNQGRTWGYRSRATGYTGTFCDLVDTGKEILATTTKGLFYSTNDGRTWGIRKRH